MRRLLLSLAIISVISHQASSDTAELENHLRDQYQDKVFVLRGFLAGDELRYDAAGAPIGNPRTGLWTTDGFVLITEAKVDGQNLVIKGRRMMVVSEDKGFQFLAGTPKKRKKAPSVYIEATIGSGAEIPEIDALLKNIFLSEHDNLAALVPLYWQTCLSAGSYEVNDPNYEGCQFSAEIRSVPGVSSRPGIGVASEKQGSLPQPESVRVFKVGNGVSAPRQIFVPEPRFTDVAREAGVDGVVTLLLILDDKGKPQNVEILKPLGAGLDEEAVHAISTWTFDPAKKDGHPVAVKIAVQAQFHRQ